MKMNVKRLALAAALIVGLSTPKANAQLKGGDNLVNVGIGFGSAYSYASGYKGFPAVSVSFERVIPKELGPGLLAVGGIVSYRKISDKFEGNNGEVYGTYKNSYSNTVIGIRGTYHWEQLNTEKYDVYGGVQTGLRFENYKSKWDGDTYKDKYTHFYGSIIVGGRYFFSSNLSAFAELGYDVTWTKVGISFKF
ncbi:hypothetical protein MKQ68_08090 [Chitinophaga horti]|uniref:Outer membrane protein beta-barrel domain-containing protein n=1 Tax=Chitinophaga horti TaxID=2920382 RepID=A0ABY6J611_9BACT|nr:hypothetical protein [Chitinophaga horti]UYQ95053.1 hypothetical protein MKQ68_08090 [Chitinophaga horti]